MKNTHMVIICRSPTLVALLKKDIFKHQLYVDFKGDLYSLRSRLHAADIFFHVSSKKKKEEKESSIGVNFFFCDNKESDCS